MFFTVPVLAATLMVGSLAHSRRWHPWLKTDLASRLAQLTQTPDEVVDCDILVGGGWPGRYPPTAYESFAHGPLPSAMTELTDWVGGQISSQGTTALDESKQQRNLLFYSSGLQRTARSGSKKKYGELNPGQCWVSASCFMPYDANAIFNGHAGRSRARGRRRTEVVPEHVWLKTSASAQTGRQIEEVIAIQHSPAPGTAPLNTDFLSEIIEDAYTYDDSERLSKTIIQFVPHGPRC